MTSMIQMSGKYCEHCKKDTEHRCFQSNHERDSSRDWQQCEECYWIYSELTEKYEPPVVD